MKEYPTDEELKQIEEWTPKNSADMNSFLDFLESVWWSADWGFIRKKNHKLELHTGGWSGNESIIDSLRKNIWFWMGWKIHRVGGHFYFNHSNIYRKKFWVKK